MLLVYRKKPADSPVSESVVFDSDTFMNQGNNECHCALASALEAIATKVFVT